MDESSIIQYIAETFAGVDVVRPETGDSPEIAVGDTFFIYDPHRNLEAHHRFPFATIVTKDYGDFDCASNLNAPMNIPTCSGRSAVVGATSAL